MAGKKTDQPTPPDQTPPPADMLGPEHLMPWEIGEPGSGGGDHQVAMALNELLEDDPEFADDVEGGREPSAEDDDQDDSVESDDEEFDEEDVDEEDDSDEDDSEDESKDDEEVEEGEGEVIDLDDEILVPIKIDGEEVEVTLREALDGHQRQKDYTRKTQKLAEREKALAGELSQTVEIREQLGQQLDLLAQALSEDSTPVDWDKLREEEPDRFANEWAAYQHRQYKLQQVKALQEQNEAAAAEERAKIVQANVVEERNKLPSVIPEWKDDAAVDAGLKEIREYIADKYGATDAELDNIVDARFVAMARKAMLFDRAKSKGKEKIRGRARTKGKRSGRVLAPGAKPTQQKSKAKAKSKASVKRYKQARARLKQSGRVEDAAAALLELEDE